MRDKDAKKEKRRRVTSPSLYTKKNHAAVSLLFECNKRNSEGELKMYVLVYKFRSLANDPSEPAGDFNLVPNVDANIILDSIFEATSTKPDPSRRKSDMVKNCCRLLQQPVAMS